ncbi:PTS sugar transporter subunit IIB [Anaerofustis sp.]|uniref:PTS system mannose/fructose/N-acetylgalactosamine-transporter subunit IIB n=1 Tax=Anaerofustis sp. TaxID=1872517 RepID=UPI0025BDC8CB|nr:PTS sugar transporter subunit IIB [Anaerofustis sp.]
MANINLVRIDSRLIHGQVITKWLKMSGANRIIIVDDELAKDDFMSIIYTTAAPKDVSVEILSIDDAKKGWMENKLGDGSLLILFKDIKTCYRLKNEGVDIEKIQIGGLPSAPGRTVILRAVSFDEDDVMKLKELHESGVEINIHIIPEEPKMSYENMIKKFEEKK